jgi:CHAT domain-containing protein
MQQILKIIPLVIAFTSCNVNKKNENSALLYKKGDNFFQSYQYYKAIDCYKNYLKKSTDKNDSIYIKSYIQLYKCYTAIDKKTEASKIAVIIDSLEKLQVYQKYKFDYLLYQVSKNYSTKNYRKAIDKIKIILKHYTEIDTNRAGYYYQLGDNYYKLKILDSSNYYYKSALKIACLKKDKHAFEFVNYYTRLGDNIYTFEYNFNKSKKYFDSAFQKASQSKYIDSSNFAYDLVFMACDYASNGEYNKANLYFSQANSIYDKLGTFKNDKMEVLYRESFIESYLNKFDAANAHADQAIEFYQKNNDPERLILALQSKAIAYHLNHQYDRALPIFYQAINIFRKNRLVPGVYDYELIANCYGKKNSKDSANFYFHKCIQKYKNEKNTRIVDLLMIVGEYSRFLNTNKQYNEALKLVEQNENVISYGSKEKNIYYAYFIYWKALSLQNLKNYEQSLDVYQKVICNSIEPDFYGSNFEVPIFEVSQIISHDNLIDALIGKGDVLSLMANQCKNNERRLYLYEKSYEHYIKAKEVVENHNRQMDTEDDQLKFAGEKSPVNNKIFIAALQMYYLTHRSNWLEKSFIAADNCKANVISMNVLDNVYKKLGGIPDSIIEKDKKLKEEISEIQSSINELKKSKDENSLHLAEKQNKLVELLKESANLDKQLDENYPLYYKLKYQSHNVNIEQLSRFTGNQKSIVEYEFAGDSLYTFLLSNNSIKLFSQSSAGIDDSITKLRKLITYVNDKSFTENGIKEYISSASWLFKKLFQPIVNSLNNNDIIIIPDGTINLLPFEALVTNTGIPKHADYGSLNYLVNKYTFSYSFSSELYTMQQQLYSPSVDGVLAFAPNYESYTNPKHRGSIMLSPLTGNTSEAKKVVKIMDGESIIGKQATKETFIETLHENKILHFAMHAIVDNDNSNSSALAFTQTNDTDANNLLYTYEISNLSLNSPLAVLSACNSGNGQLMKGEGLVSLARSFVYAGCPSMVYTLWSISDNSTSEFMQEFYKNLKQHMTIDKALQAAKNKYISLSDPRYAHPHYWAAFVQSGKTQPIQFKMPHSYYKWGIIWGSVLSVILISVSIIYIRKYIR